MVALILAQFAELQSDLRVLKLQLVDAANAPLSLLQSDLRVLKSDVATRTFLSDGGASIGPAGIEI